jgi:hypothetical protein
MKRLAASVFVCCALMLGLQGCSVFHDTASDDGVVYGDGKFPVLTATGYSIVSQQPGKTRDQKIIEAMRASKLDAYRELTEQVYGIQIDSYTTLRDYIQTDEQLDASVSGLLKGAKVVRTYPLSSNVYATELSLDTKTLYRMYQIRGAL